jgi:pimeloyl-ACP methyl ester carboxylesterase
MNTSTESAATHTVDSAPTLLLVHGAWHRSSCWTPLRVVLGGFGLSTRTVDLPSAGEGIPNGGVLEDAEAIGNAIEDIDGPVVVVAHSYGGIPATQAVGQHPEVSRLVYLAAFAPDKGESMFDAVGAPAPADVSGLATIDNPRTALYGDLSDEAAEAALETLVQQSLRSFTEPVTSAAWGTVPSTYVITEKDQALAPALQEKMARRADEIYRLASGHSPFLSGPFGLAEMLTEVIGIRAGH